MKEIHKILYVRTDRIGDVLMNLPAIRQLRQNYPKAWIALLARSDIASFLKGHPDLDETIPLSGDADRNLGRSKFDMVVISNPQKSLHWRFFYQGIPVRVGHDRKWGFLLTHRLSREFGKARTHEFERNLALTGLVCKSPWGGKYEIPGEDPGVVFSGRPVVVVHAGTSNPKKRWPLDRYAALIESVCERLGAEVILIGGHEEIAAGHALAEKTKRPLRDLTGQLSLKQTAGLFRRPEVRCLVSSDSGPAHIAWMCGTPVLVFFSKNDPGSDPVRWGPRDSKSISIFKEISDITSEEAMDAVTRLMGLR